MAEFEKRIRKIGKGMQDILARQHYSVITLNASAASMKRYEFLVDEDSLDLTGDEIDNLVETMIMQGQDRERLWFSNDYVVPAYQQGTGMAYTNIALQSKPYKMLYPDLVALLSTPEYRRRIGYIKGREFEEIKGFSSKMKTDLRVILMDGMAQGLNPLVIAEQISSQTETSIKDANRIARTEITTALKRARADEAEMAMNNLGLPIMMMQISALSPTTRLSHALRHAKLFTVQQMRDWMSTSPNMINCKCTFVEVMVDEDGTPWVPEIIERARAMWPEDAQFTRG